MDYQPCSLAMLVLRCVRCIGLNRSSGNLFPKIAEGRFDNLYSVQTVTSARGEQHRAGACTPFAAIADFQIEFPVVPQIPNSSSPFAFSYANSGGFAARWRKYRCPNAVFGSGETVRSASVYTLAP